MSVSCILYNWTAVAASQDHYPFSLYCQPGRSIRFAMFGPLDAALLVPTSDVCEVWRPRSHWLHHPSRWWRIACELARNISMKACKLLFLSPRWDDMTLHDIWPSVAKTFSGHWSKRLKSRTVTTKSTNDVNQFFLENYINVVGVNPSVGARWGTHRCNVLGHHLAFFQLQLLHLRGKLIQIFCGKEVNGISGTFMVEPLAVCRNSSR